MVGNPQHKAHRQTQDAYLYGPMMQIRLSVLEIFLLQLGLWFGLWLLGDFLASILTLAIGAVILAILTIALLAEWVEPTKVPRRYFYIMGVSLLAPLVAAVLYISIFGGKFSFLQ